jgi:catechol 2,3-dioxygenase-like lactoylglutathione lyase family enzyme
MEAHVRYVALQTDRPDVLADFYRQHFGLDEFARSDEGHVSLTDGYYNLSILNSEARVGSAWRESSTWNGPVVGLGLSHIGIAVDDVRELLHRLEQFAGPQSRLLAEDGGSFHGEYKILDPDGLPISLSTTNFGVPEGNGTRRVPSIRQVGLSVPNNLAMQEFYTRVFGFRAQGDTSVHELRPGVPEASRFCGDGESSFQILSYPVATDDVAPGATPGARYLRYGLNNIGFLVPDLELTLKGLPEGSAWKWASSQAPGEWRAVDPDGNEFDLVQSRGYEVDANATVRA